MSFLQPWMLAAIPLAAIPIVIHLVNQRRFQTIPWAAMRFLLEANRMSSGYTQLRQWLILAMRTLALLALFLFTARPLTSGIMAILQGESGTQAIVILDRSPSMGDMLPDSNRTRLQAAIEQLASTFETLGVQKIVQIDEASGKSEEFSSLNQWLRTVSRTPWSATSDLPGMLEQALVYAKNNPASNAVVWIASDMRQSDWRGRDGRWRALRDGFESLPQSVRFSILDLSRNRAFDRAIRVVNAQCVDSQETPTLSLSFRIDPVPGAVDTDASGMDPSTIPVEIGIGSSRTSIDLPWTATGSQLNDYPLPLPGYVHSASESDIESSADGVRGWGWVRIPSDRNPFNDVSFFVFEQHPLRRTLIVSDQPELIDAIEWCASIAPQQSIRCETEQITQRQLTSVALDHVALLVWHDSLPSGDTLEVLDEFVRTGGQVLFVPPENPDDTTAFGFRWLQWREVANDSPDRAPDSDPELKKLARIAQWQNDSELLANTLSGAPLPLGQLGLRRICSFSGPLTPLANVSDGQPILAVINHDELGLKAGSVVVCATTPSDRDSTLAGDGVVLYVAIQRMLANGAQRVASIRRGTAGVDRTLVDPNSQLKAGDETAPSTQYAMHAGVYESSKTLVSIDRGTNEEDIETLDESSLKNLFGDLEWSRIGVGSDANRLVQEVWRWFVIAMIGSLLVEALLCLPRRRQKPTLTTPYRS